MKRIIVLVLAIGFVICSVGGMAAVINQSTADGQGNTNMTYTVAQTFSVTIPENVTVGNDGTITVAAGALIPHDNSINVKLTTCDFTLTNGNDDMTYTIKKGTDAITLDNASNTVLTHAAGTSAETSGTLSFALVEGESPIYSGAYIDQITFTVSVDPTPAQQTP